MGCFMALTKIYFSHAGSVLIPYIAIYVMDLGIIY